jgi:hypothetical protein
VTLLVAGFLAVRHTAGHALAGFGLLTIAVIAAGCLLFAAGLVVVSAASIRQRRAAAGACLTCSHPCRESVDPGGPAWPDRPLTRAALPVAAVPRQRQAQGPRAAEPALFPAGTADRR